MQKTWLVLACGAAMLPAALQAQTPDVDPEAETELERAWDVEVEASYLLQRGNSDSESVVGKVAGEYDKGNWRQTAKLEGVNTMADSDGEEERTAERYYGSYKLDRKLEENNYLFNVLTYDKDAFSGFHYQASYALGLGRRFLDTEVHTLDLEAGPGYRVDCLEPEGSYSGCDNTEESAIARLAGDYKWQIGESSSFRQSLVTEVADENTTMRSETSLTSKINDHFAMRLTHLITRDSEVPEDTNNSDHETTVSLVYSF